MAKKNNFVWIVLVIGIILIILNWSSISSFFNIGFSAESFCGDGFCDNNETSTTCPIDCGASNCISGQIDYISCGDSFKPNLWASRQCVEGQWRLIEGVSDACYCVDNSVCSGGYTCQNHVCTQENAKFCNNTGDCIPGFYCTATHTCSKCSEIYSLFSIQDCEFSNFACSSSNECFNLAQDYCTNWKCNSNTCVAQITKRFEGCCSDKTPCESNQTCQNHYCVDVPVVPKKPVSIINVIITFLIIGGVGVGIFFAYNKWFKNK